MDESVFVNIIFIFEIFLGKEGAEAILQHINS